MISGKRNRKPFGVLICKSLHFSTQSITIVRMDEMKLYDSGTARQSPKKDFRICAATNSIPVREAVSVSY